MSIHRIDGEFFDPSVIDLNFIAKRFPHIRTYTLSRKMRSLEKNNPLRKKTIDNINAMLLRKNSHVRWGVVKRKYNPIELFWHGRVIYQNEIEIFHAKK